MDRLDHCNWCRVSDKHFLLPFHLTGCVKWKSSSTLQFRPKAHRRARSHANTKWKVCASNFSLQLLLFMQHCFSCNTLLSSRKKYHYLFSYVHTAAIHLVNSVGVAWLEEFFYASRVPGHVDSSICSTLRRASHCGLKAHIPTDIVACQSF